MHVTHPRRWIWRPRAAALLSTMPLVSVIVVLLAPCEVWRPIATRPAGMKAVLVAAVLVAAWLLAVELRRAGAPTAHARAFAPPVFALMVALVGFLALTGYVAMWTVEVRVRRLATPAELLADAEVLGAVTEDADGKRRIAWPDRTPSSRHAWGSHDAICGAMSRHGVERFLQALRRYTPPEQRAGLRAPDCSQDGVYHQVERAWRSLISNAEVHGLRKQVVPASHETTIFLLALELGMLLAALAKLFATVGARVTAMAVVALLALWAVLETTSPVYAHLRVELYDNSALSAALALPVGLGLIAPVRRRSALADHTLGLALLSPAIACVLMHLRSGVEFFDRWLFHWYWANWYGPVPSIPGDMGAFAIAVGFLALSPLVDWLLARYRRLPRTR